MRSCATGPGGPCRAIFRGDHGLAASGNRAFGLISLPALTFRARKDNLRRWTISSLNRGTGETIMVLLILAHLHRRGSSHPERRDWVALEDLKETSR